MSRIGFATGRRSLAETNRSWAEWFAWIATEDHCEWANRYVAWLKTPLGVLLVGAVCSLMCGLFVAPQGYVLLAAITAVVAVGLAWPLIAIRGVRCRFVFDARRGREGQASGAKLIVTNRWPWPVWGLAVNDPLLAGQPESVLALARVAGWSTATFNCSLVPTQRGVYPNREVRVGTGFPFGLYQASRSADVPRQLVVWPQTFWLPPLGSIASRPHWRGVVTEGRAGSDGTRLGVRDHRVGDSLRDVHWAKTARYDRLIVNERESATVEDTTVVVEIDPLRDACSDGHPLLEWRLRIAASLCQSFAANHGRVDLWLGGTKLSAGRVTGDLEWLLDELARFQSAAAAEAIRRRDTRHADRVITIEAEGASIVLRRSGSEGVSRHPESTRRGWIIVDSLSEAPGQVLRGWRRGCEGRLGGRRISRAG